MVVHCLTFANVPGLGSLLRADAWPEGIHQYPPKWSHFSIAICGFGCFWGTTIFGNIHLFIYIYIDIYFYLFIFICGVWPSAGIILHMKWDAALDLRNDPARRAAYDAGKLGSDLAPKMQTLKTPHLGLTLVCFSWGFLISLPTLLNTWKLGRSKVTFKIIS